VRARTDLLHWWIERPSSDLGGWVLRAGVAAFFIVFGYDKFGTDPHNGWVAVFNRIGLGQWFRVATGVIEIGAGALYVFPATCRISATLLALTMLGAIVAHVTVLGDPGSSIMPAAALAATVGIALREPDQALHEWTKRR
jgi:putative oxidoreductase